MQVDSRVFAFTVLVAVLTGILAGLAPAWHFSRPNVNDTLKEGSRGGSPTASRQRFRTLLVISEIALSLVLLVGAGLMVKGFRTLVDQHGLRSEQRSDIPCRVAGEPNIATKTAFAVITNRFCEIFRSCRASNLRRA